MGSFIFTVKRVNVYIVKIWRLKYRTGLKKKKIQCAIIIFDSLIFLDFLRQMILLDSSGEQKSEERTGQHQLIPSFLVSISFQHTLLKH